jgi:hypothetical protein
MRAVVKSSQRRPARHASGAGAVPVAIASPVATSVATSVSIPVAIPAAIAAALAALSLVCQLGLAANSAPDDALVYFIWPADGAVILGGRFWLRMGLRNMGIAPKGVQMHNTGHHHLIVDAPLTPAGEAIPSDRNHLHFGAGETEARIELPPGRHTLQLLLGDQDHKPHDPPVHSKPISITVVR